MPTIEVNKITISYQLHEPAPESTSKRSPVLLVNGLADAKETWSLQIPALVFDGYTVLAFDNRGIGASSKPTGTPYTAQLLAADTKALIEALNIPKPFHLLGVSMGGMIAQSYALMYPEDLASLILSCTYARPNIFCSRMFDYWADVAKAISISVVMKDVVSRAFTPAFFEPEHAQELKEVDDAMDKLGEDLTVPEYLCQLNVIQVFDTTADLHKLAKSNLKGKVLVLAGEEDILIPTALSYQLHGMIGGSEWCVVQGGHACLWELPDSFNHAVLKWLDKHG